jgi:S-adenosylmethionine-diacylgycerolhomoserine-N-methlytransferase
LTELGTSAQQILAFYRVHAPIYDATRWLSLHGRARAVGQLGVEPAHRVLEIGCGTGSNFAAIVQGLDRHAGSLVGVDFSPAMLARARQRIALAHWSNVRIEMADATELSLQGRFHRILVSYALSIIPEWRKALERAVWHLAPGGKIVIVDFGDFAGFGVARGLMFQWLCSNHTGAGRTYADAMGELAREVASVTGWRGYSRSSRVGNEPTSPLVPRVGSSRRRGTEAPSVPRARDFSRNRIRNELGRPGGRPPRSCGEPRRHGIGHYERRLQRTEPPFAGAQAPRLRRRQSRADGASRAETRRRRVARSRDVRDVFGAFCPARIYEVYVPRLRPLLSPFAQRFWDRNLDVIAKNIYHRGKLGTFLRVLRGYLKWVGLDEAEVGALLDSSGRRTC